MNVYGVDSYDSEEEVHLLGSLSEREEAVRMNTVQLDRLTFLDVKYRVKTGTQTLEILKGMSASLPAGKLSAVLGPSGAGKSSLFDVLLGVTASGEIEGRLPAQQSVAYVTQDIFIPPFETLNNVMWYYANLALPTTCSTAYKRRLIDDILASMDMHHNYNTYTGGMDLAWGAWLDGGLSSGERRRLQVCVNLLKDPEVLVLDEPTTGLDGANALHLVQVLKKTSKTKQLTAIASLHQPRREIFLELDHILLLAKGYIIYSGSALDMVTFLETVHKPIERQDNPSSYALEFLCSLNEDQCKSVSEAALSFSGPYSELGTVPANQKVFASTNGVLDPEGPRMVERMKVLAGRAWRTYTDINSFDTAYKRLLATVVSAFIFGFICLNISKSNADDVQNFASLQLMLAMLCVRYSMISSMWLLSQRAWWIAEKPQNLYVALDNYLTLQITEALLSPIFSVASYMIVWVIVCWDNYKNGDILVRALWVSVLGQQAIRSTISFFVLMTRDFAQAMPRQLVMFVLLSVFGGGFIKIVNIPAAMQWVCYINPYFYLFSGLMINEYNNYNDIGCGDDNTTTLCIQGDAILEDYGFDDFTYGYCCWMLVLVSLVYSVLGFIFYRVGPRTDTVYYGSSPIGRLIALASPQEPLTDEEALLPTHQRSGAANSGNPLYGTSLPVKSTAELAVKSKGEQGGSQYLTYKNINYKVEVEKVEKHILHSVSFNVKRRTMFAIMGPSGAGKTSLLKIVGGWQMPGNVTADSLSEVSIEQLGYVTADDMLPVMETVEETLQFYAYFLLGDCPSFERKTRIAEVMSLMGLSHRRNVFVGGMLSGGVNVRGLSGGERRRLSIGCSLLKMPEVLVLDEPTSGLDVVTALEVMSTAHKLTATDKTVICTIHQPCLKTFAMFSQVMFLARGVKVYIGPPDDTIPMFQEASGRKMAQFENPADFALDSLAGLLHSDVEELVARMPKMEEEGPDPEDKASIEVPLAPPSKYPCTPFSMRFRLIFGRMGREFTRNPQLLRERIVLFGLAVLIFSLPYSDLSRSDLKNSEVVDRLGLIFMSSSIMIVQGINTIPIVQRQRLLFYHEMNLGFYKIWELFFSLSMLSLLVFTTYSSLVAYILAWSMAGMRSLFGYWLYGIFNAAVLSFTGEMIALISGLYFPDVIKAMTLMMGTFVTVLIPCSGMLISVPDIPYPIQVLAYINPLRYGCAGEVINQYEGRSMVQDESSVQYEDGDAVIEYLGYDDATGDKLGNTFVNLSVCMAMYGCGYALIKWQVMKSMMGSSQ